MPSGIDSESECDSVHVSADARDMPIAYRTQLQCYTPNLAVGLVGRRPPQNLRPARVKASRQACFKVCRKGAHLNMLNNPLPRLFRHAVRKGIPSVENPHDREHAPLSIVRPLTATPDRLYYPVPSSDHSLLLPASLLACFFPLNLHSTHEGGRVCSILALAAVYAGQWFFFKTAWPSDQKDLCLDHQESSNMGLCWPGTNG